MSKTPTEFARELDEAIAEHVEQLRGEIDPLVDAYLALADGQVPPSLAAMFARAEVGASKPPPPPAPRPKRRPVRDAPQASSRAGATRTTAEQGRANKQAIVQALSTADEPLSVKDLDERVDGLGASAIRDHLLALAREGTVTCVAEQRGPYPATWALPSRMAEWDDPETVDEDDDDDVDDVVEADADAGDDETGAAAQAELERQHRATIPPDVSTRVRKQLAAERAQPSEPDVDENDRRPTGERLVRLTVDQVDGTRAKPRDVARQLVLPAPEVAQAMRVAQGRGWIERLDDGTFTAVPGAMPAVNGHDLTAA